MIHLRIVSPSDRAEQAVDILKMNPAVINVVHLPGVAQCPEGDLLMADVAREDASVVLSDLRELDLDKVGSIALEDVDATVSEFAAAAAKYAKGSPSDAVVWEQVEARTSESIELSFGFLSFMVISGLICSAGIFLDQAILIVGAMVVGPEFGPIAAFCVAVTTKRMEVARRSFLALAIGFPLAITAVFVAAVIFKATGVTPNEFSEADHSLSAAIASPDVFAVFVAILAGVAGVLSLTTAKSSALMGVAISLTTIPAAANIGIATAYADWESWEGSVVQLLVNVGALLVSGVATLAIQRYLYGRRRLAHLTSSAREASGMPVGRSLRHTHVLDAAAMQKAFERLERERAEQEAKEES